MVKVNSNRSRSSKYMFDSDERRLVCHLSEKILQIVLHKKSYTTVLARNWPPDSCRKVSYRTKSCRIMSCIYPAGQGSCRTKNLQDKKPAGQESCMTRILHDKKPAGQETCKIRILQDKKPAGQESCRTRNLQDKKPAGQDPAGWGICRTESYRASWRTESYRDSCRTEFYRASCRQNSIGHHAGQNPPGQNPA